MITILSPAKKLSKDCFGHEFNFSQSKYLDHSEKLISILKSFEPPILMDVMGISEEFDVTKSPFYNKIVVIGTSVEVHHDYKQTPY